MKRLALSVLSVCLLSFATGCCWWPGYGMPMYGGCPNGQCPPYGGAPAGAYIDQGGVIQTNYPVASPVITQPIAYPQPVYPTMAVESLPTYR